MKDTKPTLIVLCAFLALIIFGRCNDDDTTNFSDTNLQFVRFSVQKDAFDLLVEQPNIPPNDVELSSYSFPGTYAKLAVKLSQVPNQNTVSCAFAVNAPGLLEGTDYEVVPTNKQLAFQGNQLVDTILVRLLHPIASTQEINLKLTNTNPSNITLGYPNDTVKLDQFKLTFLPTNPIMRFNQNIININGSSGEQFQFNVEFPNGYFQQDITPNIITATNAINYTLEQQPLTHPRKVSYLATINEDLSNPDITYTDFITLTPTPNYTPIAPSILQIIKNAQTDRDVVASTNFFDVTNPFYRLFGERWQFDSGDSQCEWRAWNAFAVPVEVPANSEFDKNGDGYHDYKVGFVSPNAPLGTNPFDMRRIFNGESVSSPGLNLTQALEFFPENGNNPTKGAVIVVPQIVQLVRSSDDAIINIPISGSGTYEQVNAANNVFRLEFEVKFDLTTVNGNPDVRFKYVLFNTAGQPEPNPITDGCLDAFDL